MNRNSIIAAARLHGLLALSMLVPLGWLFFNSGFMPKTLDILLMVGCFGYLADSFAGLVMPDWRSLTAKGVMVPAVAELTTVFWLLVLGVKCPAKEQRSLAAA